jgi:hypothetical protein
MAETTREHARPTRKAARFEHIFLTNIRPFYHRMSLSEPKLDSKLFTLPFGIVAAESRSYLTLRIRNNNDEKLFSGQLEVDVKVMGLSVNQAFLK